MSEIRHASFTKATKHSDTWHDGVCANSRLEIKEKAPKPFVDGEFFLREIGAVRKGKASQGNAVVFISDLHWDGQHKKMYQKLAQEISALEADFILFGGDLGVFADSIDEAMEWLSSISVRKNKFAVSGNRESCLNWLDSDFWREEYAKAGFRYLCNEIADEGDLTFYGADDYRFGTPDWSPLADVDKGQPVISFMYNPDFAASANLKTFIGDIVLCGHTHGGQLCFPLIGPLYTSSEFGKQFLHGWNSRDDGTLCLVSNGIGESGFGIVRRRIRCPREVVLLRME